MPKYRVFVPEVHYQTVEIEAVSQEDAARRVEAGEGDYLNNALEYSHTLDGGNRTVRDPDGNETVVDLDEDEEEYEESDEGADEGADE